MLARGVGPNEAQPGALFFPYTALNNTRNTLTNSSLNDRSSVWLGTGTSVRFYMHICVFMAAVSHIVDGAVLAQDYQSGYIIKNGILQSGMCLCLFYILATDLKRYHRRQNHGVLI